MATSGKLMPREHGAYAQLGFPLVTGLALGRGAPGAWAFAVAGIALFLANEPVAVLTGVRGKRLRGQLAAASRSRLTLLMASAGLAGVAAVLIAPARAWWAALVPGGLALALLPLLAARKVKTLGGELLVAAVLASFLLPVARSGPARLDEALVASAVWLVAFAGGILAVHAIKVEHKGRLEGRWTLVAAPLFSGAAIVAAVILAMVAPDPALETLAVVPPAGVTLAMGLAPPHPRHLKRVGWTVVAADAVALALLLVL